MIRMRRMMTKEVTKTTVKLAKMVTENGLPKAEPMEDEILLGNVSLEKAQKAISKKHGAGVTVFAVEVDTSTYEMDVEEFIKVATLKVAEETPVVDQEDSEE